MILGNGTTTQLTSNPWGDLYPSWSRANGKITYTGCVENVDVVWQSTYRPFIYVMNADGSEATNLTANDEWASSWSPDGQYIVFSTAADGNEEVYRMKGAKSDDMGYYNLSARPNSNEQGPVWSSRAIVTPRPKVVSALPVNGQTDVPIHTTFLQATFDQPITIASCTTDHAIIKNGRGETIPSTVHRADGDPKTIILALKAKLQMTTHYTVTLNCVYGSNGAPIEPYTWSFDTPWLAYDLEPTLIDVNQGISNTVSIDETIMGRNTVVRVRVRDIENAPVVDNVKVALHVYEDSGSGLVEISSSPFITSTTIKREYSDFDIIEGRDAANFYFSAREVTEFFKIGPTYVFKAMVDPDNEIGETYEGNNLTPEPGRRVLFTNSPRIEVAILSAYGSNGDGPSQDQINSSLGYVAKYWPLGQYPNGVSLHIALKTSRVYQTWPSIKDRGFIEEVHDHLSPFESDYDIVLVYINGDPNVPKPIAITRRIEPMVMIWTWTKPDTAAVGVAVAHEAGHAFAHRFEAQIEGEDYEFDQVSGYDVCKEGTEPNEGAFDIFTDGSGYLRLNVDGKGDRRASIMCADCMGSWRPGRRAETLYWIRDVHYRNALLALPEGDSGADLPKNGAQAILVSGTLLANGTATLDPVARLTGLSLSQYHEGSYIVEIQDGDDQILDSRKIEPDFEVSDSPSPTTSWPFAVVMADQPEARRVVIRHQGQELAVRAASANAPKVTVTSPNGGGIWSGTRTITWKGSDSDGDKLWYDVLYSSDNGVTWRMVASNVEVQSLSWDTNSVPGSGRALIRVVVSDGFYSAEDQSNSTFSIPTKEPEVWIESPQADQHFIKGQTIFLRGGAYDLEDGMLGEAAFRWTYDRGAELGRGSMIEIDSLSVGEHTITLTATDSGRLAESQQVRIYVDADADHDGMPDDWETANGLDTTVDDAWQDWDADALSNGDEFLVGTNPKKYDTDGDRMGDGAEIDRGSNPLDPTSVEWVKVYLPRVTRSR